MKKYTIAACLAIAFFLFVQQMPDSWAIVTIAGIKAIVVGTGNIISPLWHFMHWGLPILAITSVIAIITFRRKREKNIFRKYDEPRHTLWRVY